MADTCRLSHGVRLLRACRVRHHAQRCNASALLQWVGAEASGGAEAGYYERRSHTACGGDAEGNDFSWTFGKGELVTVVAFADPHIIECGAPLPARLPARATL
jgi:hypothetical protein